MTDQLFAAPFPAKWMPEQIKTFFEQVGPVRKVVRPRDQETGAYRKFAFVSMSSPELAAAAVEQLNGADLAGSTLTVKLADKPPAKVKAKARPAAPSASAQPDLEWEQRAEALARVLAAPGTVSTAKITLVGRPGWIEAHGQTVMVSLMHQLKPTGFPKGVPAPPDTPTTYVVFIGSKQWKKVAAAIEDPEDVLIIEGQPLLDGALPVVAVFATNVNTKLMTSKSGRR